MGRFRAHRHRRSCTSDRQVQKALDRYQAESGAEKLPPLAEADFDFKATSATTVGGTISLFIFKIGASHENDVTNEVTFTYKLPPPLIALEKGPKRPPPPTLADDLVKTIKAAAHAVQGSATVGNLKFSQLTVQLQYGVKVEGSGSAGPTISIVTVGLSGDKNKNTVQTVKLVFADKS